MSDPERLDFLNKHPNTVEWADGLKCWRYSVRFMAQAASSLREAIDGAMAEERRTEDQNGTV